MLRMPRRSLFSNGTRLVHIKHFKSALEHERGSFYGLEITVDIKGKAE